MIVDIISILLCLIGCLMIVLSLSKSKLNNRKLVSKLKDPTIAFLIPARDESRVIGSLLDSIKKQTYPIAMEDVYVIIEDETDKTVDICKEYQATYLLRTHKEMQRKGYALDEGYKQISKKYDIYFIFDADNILDKNYVAKMLETYHQGYDIACGYRNCKNGNNNVIAAVSSLTFSMINTLGNNRKRKYHSDILISGTGFYITGELLELWNGYPFHSLTEDYELSLYITLYGVTSYYNDEAIFYDEQPTKYKQTVKQRVRWIKGYFSSRKKYIPLIRKKMQKKNTNYGSQYSACFGVKPYVLIVIGIALYLIKTIFCIVINMIDHQVPIRGFLIMFILVILGIYLILMLVTYAMIKKDKLNLSRSMKIKAILYNPIFLATYVPCALKALFQKNVTWEKIEHKINSFQ